MHQILRHASKPPKALSSRPIGRPPSPLVTPVIGWAERRRYARFCSAPCVPVQPTPPPPKSMRGTPATRARTPSLSQARIHHDAAAPTMLAWGCIQLRKTCEYGIAWQCSTCTSWTRDPASKHGYVHHCTICRLTRPPRVVLLNSLDTAYFREHAALAHAAAARMRSERYAMLLYGPTKRFKRESVTPAEFFLNEAERRARLFAPLPVTDEQAAQERTVIQVWCHGERYVGLGGTGFTAEPLPTALNVVLTPWTATTQGRLSGSQYQEPSLIALASLAAQQEQPMPNLTPNPHRSTLNGALELLGLELANTLTATRICRVHATQARRRELRVTFTVDEQQVPAWHEAVARVLEALETSGVDVAIAQVCSRHEGELLAPWQIRVTADDAERLQRDVMQVRRAFQRLVNPDVDKPVPRSFDWFHEACERHDANS